MGLDHISFRRGKPQSLNFGTKLSAAVPSRGGPSGWSDASGYEARISGIRWFVTCHDFLVKTPCFCLKAQEVLSYLQFLCVFVINKETPLGGVPQTIWDDARNIRWRDWKPQSRRLWEVNGWNLKRSPNWKGKSSSKPPLKFTYTLEKYPLLSSIWLFQGVLNSTWKWSVSWVPPGVPFASSQCTVFNECLGDPRHGRRVTKVVWTSRPSNNL